MNGRARSDVLRDEAVARRRPEVWDDCHPGTPRKLFRASQRLPRRVPRGAP
jgi:hypothetical protein